MQTDERTKPRSVVLLKTRTRHTRWLVLGFVPLIAVMDHEASRPELVHAVLKTLGITALVACFVGRFWCALYIGGRKNQELVTAGPYSLVRNPLYLSSFVGLIGVGLISEMMSFLAVSALCFAIYYRKVVGREEAHLIEIHGAAFQDYCRQVRRWIPKPSAWREAERLEIRPRVIFAHLRDTSAFFSAFLFFELTDVLHDLSIVPVILTLP
jgi:protein-S-isoprenylcysteine O-methyltransferase Ste14